MTKKYPIILYPTEEDGRTSYSVLIPDFPGCVSQGDSKGEAFENAKRALDLHIQALIESGQAIAEPSTIDQVADNSEPGVTYGVVEIPLSEIREKALARKSTRINITFPGELLRRVDDYCEQSGIARSKLFQQLTEQFLGNTQHRGHSEDPEALLRRTLEAYQKAYQRVGDEWSPGYQLFGWNLQETLRAPLASLQDAVRHSEAFTQSKAPSDQFFVFAVLLLNSLWAFEKLRISEYSSEPEKFLGPLKNR